MKHTINPYTGKKYTKAFERAWRRNLRFVKKNEASVWFERGAAAERRRRSKK